MDKVEPSVEKQCIVEYWEKSNQVTRFSRIYLRALGQSLSRFASQYPLLACVDYCLENPEFSEDHEIYGQLYP